MSALPVLRRRRERRLDERQHSHNRLTRGLIGVGLFLSVLLGLSILAAAFFYVSLTANLPSIDLLPALLEPPSGPLLQPTRIYDRTGTHLLAVLAPEDAPRSYVPIDPNAPVHIPNTLVRATVALVQPDFWSSPGYTLNDLSNPDEHPTIAQQLVANLLLADEPPGLRRALRERILAAQLTARFGPDKILEWYLNSANYGHYAYGADAAARLYFGKSALQVNLAEATLLAAVSQAPAINPLDAPQAAIQREQQGLINMQAAGLVTAQEASVARFLPLKFQPAPTEHPVAPAFVALALSQLEEQLGHARVERGGLVIRTTLDYDLQEQASCAVRTQVLRLAGQPDPTTADGQPCVGADSLPPLAPDDSSSDAAASAVILDPNNGQLLALVGETRQGVESPFLTPHHAGTLLTPFIYLTAFTRGLSPASLLWDIPDESIPLQNLDGKFHGPLRLRMAFANDYLVPAAQVLDQMGAPLVAQTAASFGLDLTGTSGTQFLTGKDLLSPLDLAQAFGVFATQGTLNGQAVQDDSRLSASTILHVETLDRSPLLDWSAPQVSQVVSPQLAYLVNNVLSDETARWPSLGNPNAFEIGRPVAAKAGQTLDGKDTWAVGYTPYRLALVWLGSDGLSVRPAAGLWSALMESASNGQSADGWSAPAGVVRLQVCDPSGLLPTPACPNLVDEVFLDGNQPVQADTLFKSYTINRETGLLATVFTPPQLVEQRTYMLVPDVAKAWAQSAGLPTPPTTYDTIQAPQPNPDANISTPDMFAALKGKIDINGTATGDNFAYYQLQYGQGLNPSSWVSIGSLVKTPVTAGTLGTWNTSDLNGLYALQLLVVGGDQSIQTYTVQVTVDNTPPTIALDFPREGATLSLAQNKQIVFQPSVTDNLALAKVSIYLDGSLLQSFASGPFAVSWKATGGKHTLRVVALDQTGNQSELKVQFTVGK